MSYKLIKYYKDNCAPCAQLAMVLSKELPKYPELVVEERNIATYLEEAVEAGVTSVPHVFLVDQHGTVISSQRGVLGVPKMLEQHLNNDNE